MPARKPRTFEKVLESFRKHQTGMMSDAQELALMALLQWKNHENADQFTRFFDAITSSAHKTSLARWAVDMSNKTIAFDANKFKKADSATAELREAIDETAALQKDGKPIMVLTYKQAPVIQRYGQDDIVSKLESLYKRLMNEKRSELNESGRTAAGKLREFIDGLANPATPAAS